MDTRVCEFCKAYRAVVYCIADTANLCLTCDSKVHSANSLSDRHLRTVLCDSCKNQPCVVRCLDHKMFLCHGCNDKVHGSSSSSKHRRNGVSCYTGCPSAKDFAVMWGFRVMDDDDNVSLEQFFRMVKPKRRSEMNKVQRGGGLILEQILELEKVQLKEEKGSSSLTEQADPSSLESQKKSEELSGKEMIVDFSQFSSSFTLGDSFWEGKIPYNKNNQLWHQNLQDIGVCEDPICNEDDFQIPDIDLTFRNFEEQFGADSEPVSDSNNMFFVSSLDKSHKMKAFSSSFDNSIFANKPASSSISFSSRETHSPHNHTEEVISFSSPLTNKVHQKAISRIKDKKRTRAEEKQA